MKFRIYKKMQENDIDYFPEGALCRFTPNKKCGVHREHTDVPDFPRTVSNMKKQ